MALAASALALAAFLWPVGWAAAGVVSPHPLSDAVPSGIGRVWNAAWRPAYICFQLLWVVAVVQRWRTASGHARLQLAWLVVAAALSVVALAAGLIGWGTPRGGVLMAAFVPVAAGWAVVHGQQRASYQALSWLSRSRDSAEELPGDLARAVAEAVDAVDATVWASRDQTLHAVGVWPETGQTIEPSLLADLVGEVRPVVRTGVVVGAISARRHTADALTTWETRLLDHLASQAGLVLDHLSLADLIQRQRRSGGVTGLTPREDEVLALIARGYSNAAICEELHLSVKTVEPVVSAVFTKLGLQSDAASNRRVLAALAYLRG